MSVHYISAGGDPDKVIIYRPELGAAFVGNKALERLLKARSEETAGPLDAEIEEFLADLNFWREDPPYFDPAGHAFLPATAVLLLTNQCNLRCGYCYADAGTRPARQLELTHAMQAIDHVCEQAQTQGLGMFRLDFHGGGEPTTAWQLLRASTEYARSKPLPVQISLTSNAVWSPSHRDWIIANIDDLSISVDGRPATQDRNRPLPNGGGSAGIVFDNLRALDTAGRQYGVRITATEPWDGLDEDVAYLCEHAGCLTIQIEPSFNTSRGGHNASPEPEECHGFARAFLAAFDLGRSAGRRVFFSGARPGITGPTFCNAPYMALIVGPGGNLTTCYEVDKADHPLYGMSHIGRIGEEGVTIDTARRKDLHRRLSERRASCEGCFCLQTCAGDCYTRTFQAGEKGHLAHSARCDMNREITKEILLRLVAEGDGVWRSDAPAGCCHEPE